MLTRSLRRHLRPWLLRVLIVNSISACLPAAGLPDIVQESKAAAEEAWRQLTLLTAERDDLLRKVAEAERASHALSQLAGDREEGVQAAAAERSAHEKTKRENVQLQVG